MFKLKKLALFENPDLPEPYSLWGWNNLRDLVVQSCLKGVTHTSLSPGEGVVSLVKNFLPLSRYFEVGEREVFFRLPIAFGDTFDKSLRNTVYTTDLKDIDSEELLRSFEKSWRELYVPSGWAERVMFVLSRGIAKVEANLIQSEQDWRGDPIFGLPILVGEKGVIEIKVLEGDEKSKVKKALIWRALDAEDEPLDGFALPYGL